MCRLVCVCLNVACACMQMYAGLCTLQCAVCMCVQASCSTSAWCARVWACACSQCAFVWHAPPACPAFTHAAPVRVCRGVCRHDAAHLRGVRVYGRVHTHMLVSVCMHQSAGGLSPLSVCVGVHTRADMLLTRNPNRMFKVCAGVPWPACACTVSL